MADRFARVAVPVPLGRAFTYAIPASLEPKVIVGARVLCEFGRRKLLGVVLEAGAFEPELPAEKIKPLSAVVDDEPALPGELVAFLVELARYYLAPIGEVLRLALPAVERAAAERLEQQGLLEGSELDTVGRLIQRARAVPGVPEPKDLRGQAIEILQALRRTEALAVADLEKTWKNARSAVRRLERAGLVTIERVSAVVDPFTAAAAEPEPAPDLTAAQAEAVGAIVSRLDGRQPGHVLLYGVTASGKTEVYIEAARHAVASGGSALVLVPEIALTPQLVRRFRSRLGEGIAVLHSGLGDVERYAMWKRLRSGELKVAVGARSALFAPVENLRLVCVDEEHDPSFKQEEGVRYNARDMALLRAHRAGAVCVLGSATPSLASMALVQADKLTCLRLPERARKAAVLPVVETVDLRRVGPGPTGDRLLTLPLVRAIEETLAAKQQAILFLNRRGFAPSLICEACGKICECPNCSVSLTLHRAHGERLRCHYCDYQVTPTRCPSCKAQRFAEEGAGTERIEAALAAAFSTARVARLDRDVAGGAKSERILERVRSGEVDILIGTQMVTKGHDLPSVTLVGVLNADAALSMPDFRAAERTFHLLVQVAGRAGRGDQPGRVIIQTRDPDALPVRMAVRHDVDGFLQSEMRARRELDYPPFSRMALVKLDAAEEGRARAEAERLCALARRHAGPSVVIRGPAAAPIARLRNRYRFHFMLRSPDRAALRQSLLAVARAEAHRQVRVAIDVDPLSML